MLREKDGQGPGLQERAGQPEGSYEEVENTAPHPAPQGREEARPYTGDGHNGAGPATAPETPAVTQSGVEEGPEKRRAPSWLKPVGLTLLAVVLVCAILFGVRYWKYAQAHVSTDDAYLTSDVVQITPQVSGSVAKILVDENQPVQAGQLLAVLDDSTYRAGVEQARAALAVAQATAQGAANTVNVTQQTGTAQIEQAQGGVAQAQSGIASAQADVARARASIANARAGYQSSQANVNTARAALQASITARQRAVEAVRGARAQLATAQAGVRSAQANLTAAQANQVKASRDAARYAQLFAENAVSAQQVDVANAAATSAQAAVDTAQQQIQQAQSTVAQRQSDLASAQDAVRAAADAIHQAQAQLAAAQDAVGASQANIQQMQAQYLAAQQEVSAAQAKRQQAIGQLNAAQTAPRQVAVSQANRQTASAHVLEAQAALDTALINLQHTRIYAPVAGIVSKKTVEIGQQVSVGQPLMAVIPNNDIWVEANFQETQIRNVHTGAAAEITVDTFPGRVFKGHVQSLAAGTGATFALLPPENATGNFTKVVQRVPIKVTFDPNQPDLDRLRAGLSAVVTVTTK
ncbi:MAG TPA: HlyD family efflux transporter periplasmic adaptor subunit [Chthonomonadaceae bacterium]|nr:HlyD family efflux transporter periplasmic adaptor subunit [Chthonomonadaceae bacterium]